MGVRFSAMPVFAARTKEEVAALRGVDFDKRPPRKMAGWRVIAYLCEGSDEMIETLEHFALFPTKERAVVFAEKCYSKGTGCNWPAYWSWGVTKCSPYAFMQAEPTVAMEKVARC